MISTGSEDERVRLDVVSFDMPTCTDEQWSNAKQILVLYDADGK